MALSVYSPSFLNILTHLKKESFWNKPLTRTKKIKNFAMQVIGRNGNGIPR
jgi:hypothetical protein